MRLRGQGCLTLFEVRHGEKDTYLLFVLELLLDGKEEIKLARPGQYKTNILKIVDELHTFWQDSNCCLFPSNGGDSM